MTAALGVQPSLFDPEPADEAPRRKTGAPPSRHRDESKLQHLVSILEHSTNPIERVRAARELRAAVEALEAQAVRDAREEGLSWRKLGAELGAPFQTLFRRHGR